MDWIIRLILGFYMLFAPTQTALTTSSLSYLPDLGVDDLPMPIDTLRVTALEEARRLGLRGTASRTEEYLLTYGQWLTYLGMNLPPSVVPDRTIPVLVTRYWGNIVPMNDASSWLGPLPDSIEVVVEAGTGQVISSTFGDFDNAVPIDVTIADVGYLAFGTLETPQAPLVQPERTLEIAPEATIAVTQHASIGEANAAMLEEFRARGALSPYVDPTRITVPIVVLRDMALREARSKVGLQGDPTSYEECILTMGQYYSARDMGVSPSAVPDRDVPVLVVRYTGTIEGRSFAGEGQIELAIDMRTGIDFAGSVGPLVELPPVDVTIPDPGYWDMSPAQTVTAEWLSATPVPRITPEATPEQ